MSFGVVMGKPKILCLHGFLGKSSDFDFLSSEYDIFAPELSRYIDQSLEQMVSSLSKERDLSQYHILGYSFGARLGLQIYSRMNGSNKLICLAGRFELEPQEDLCFRKKFEFSLLEKLKTMSKEDFLSFWNHLPLFAYDEHLMHPNFVAAAYYFKNYGLSKQPPLKEKLWERRGDIHFYYGEKDEKYCQYAQRYLSDWSVSVLPNIGHRILQHPKEVIKICKERL
jgi:pimeloyl-ACP methyl ester carboxylesterase